MMQLRSAAIGGSREWRTVINVDNVPRSVTRADLVRMVARSNAQKHCAKLSHESLRTSKLTGRRTQRK